VRDKEEEKTDRGDEGTEKRAGENRKLKRSKSQRRGNII
jgi:hypothetical protein